jgi:hypothetical protein
MPWNDRVREAAYTSPSGVRLVFDYENVGKSVDKKTAAFDPPDANGTFVQDLGHTGRKYPLRLFFWGDDYDQEADAFEAALLERGTGKLDHPIYGVVNVVPFGSIKRRDDLKTAANQAVIELTFWETVDGAYPTTGKDPASEVLSAVSEYDVAAAEEFETTIDIDSATEQATFKSQYTVLLDTASSGLQSIADTQDDVQRQFDAVNDSINNGIDILVARPLALASQTLIMLEAPARALTDIEARLSAYATLANSIITGDDAVQQPGGGNAFHTSDLFASTYVAASIVSVINNRFDTKTGALQAADLILQQFADVAAWRDDNYQSLGEVDTGGAYQQLQEAVALTAGFLVEISFSLKQERSIILTRPRTIIDLVAELYGSIDDQLDFFIDSNNLTGSEILEVPRGREIVYYV